jgi:hypothetical protein
MYHHINTFNLLVSDIHQADLEKQLIAMEGVLLLIRDSQL